MAGSCDTTHRATASRRRYTLSAHERDRAVILLVVEEERTVRKAADKVIAPVLPYKPVFPHAAIIPNSGYCINSTISISSDPFSPVLREPGNGILGARDMRHGIVQLCNCAIAELPNAELRFVFAEPTFQLSSIYSGAYMEDVTPPISII